MNKLEPCRCLCRMRPCIRVNQWRNVVYGEEVSLSLSSSAVRVAQESPPPPCSSRSLLASSLLCDDPCAPLSMQLAPWKGGSASKGRRRSRAASCRPRNAPFLLFVPIAWERVAVCNISLKRNLERKPINNNNESARSFDY